MSDYVYVVENTSNAEDVNAILDEKIYEYNLKAIKRYDGKIIAKTIKDKSQNMVAGISGWLWADACEISFLWVKEEFRKNRLGEKLLIAFENEVRNLNCKIILVRSYAFQAPGFYEEHGYKIVSVIDNFPEGFSYYTLMKRY